MISASEFRNGVTIEYEGDIFVVLEFQHVKPGKGAAFVRTKIKILKQAAVVEKTFRPTEKMPRAHIDRLDMQYLYNDGDLYHFMNTETLYQIAVNAHEIGDTLKFVKETKWLRFFPTKAKYSVLNHLSLLNLKSQRQSLVLQATQLRVLQNLLQLKQVLQ